jgi:hypothetical protein
MYARGDTMGTRKTRGLIVIGTWIVMTGVGFFFVSGHDPFIAFFGVWAVLLATGVVSVAIEVIVRLVFARGNGEPTTTRSPNVRGHEAD